MTNFEIKRLRPLNILVKNFCTYFVYEKNILTRNELQVKSSMCWLICIAWLCKLEIARDCHFGWSEHDIDWKILYNQYRTQSTHNMSGYSFTIISPSEIFYFYIPNILIEFKHGWEWFLENHKLYFISIHLRMLSQVEGEIDFFATLSILNHLKNSIIGF